MVWRVATWLLKHITKPAVRVLRNAMRPSGKWQGE
jgi:hypothetical protein